MVFSSIVFIMVFLPLLCTIYYFTIPKAKNFVLFVASIFFYAWGEPRYVGALLCICLLNWLCGLWLSLARGKVHRCFAVAVAVFSDLGVLGYFKYANFFINNINRFFSGNLTDIDVTMPIGISFFTFQAISYVIDVYRGTVKEQRDFLNFALYVSFFPQLIAGPIVKYHDIEQYLVSRNIAVNGVIYGVKRSIVGLGKKVLLANTLGEVADKIFAAGPHDMTLGIAWLGAVSYTLQLYYDFSGYSDMAIGLGRMFGFRFLENFNYPYISKSITEFWRRWHISLGTWFKEYLYIPLGGNRRGEYRTYINLAIVFLLTGLWHGANWTFVAWGGTHGIAVIVERLSGIYKRNDFIVLRHLYTILLFVFGWVLFRSDSITFAIEYFEVMLGIVQNAHTSVAIGYYLTPQFIVVLLIAVLASTPFPNRLLFEKLFVVRPCALVLENIYLLTVFVLSVAFIVASAYNPFIYFRF